jgi:upstream activation factor subunit UAF30
MAKKKVAKKKATKKVAKKATKKVAKKATKKVAKKAAKKKATKKVAKKAAKKATKKATKKVAKKATKKVAKKATKKVAKKKATKKVAKKATKKVAKKKTKRKPNAAFMKEMTPSPALAAVVGNKPLPRTQVIKKIWVYIKKHDLQNPKNRRNILADGKLKTLFGKKEVTMFELAGIVNKHLS